MGVCLWQPPFTGIEALSRRLFSQTSCRLWLLPEEHAWEQQISELHVLKPSMVLSFLAHIREGRARYASGEDNNLLPMEEVGSIVRRIGSLCSTLATNKINPPGGIFWEAWNEPAYPNGGEWDPEDLALYVNDLGRAVRAAGLPARILAPLNQEFNERSVSWNETYCAKLDPLFVDGLVTHYYGHHWPTVAEPQDEFLRRAGYGGTITARLRQDLSYASRFGRGKWGLHCSEWNIHPPALDSQKFYASRDMAAALFVFDAIKAFIEGGLASAQFFHLQTEWISSHFGAVTYTQQKKTVLHPTGALFGLFHRYLRGDLFRVDVASPSYLRGSDYPLVPEFQVPYVTAMGSRSGNGKISLMLANKHSEDMEIRMAGEKMPSWAKCVILQGSQDSSDLALVSERACLIGGSVILPPRSIMVLD